MFTIFNSFLYVYQRENGEFSIAVLFFTPEYSKPSIESWAGDRYPNPNHHSSAVDISHENEIITL